MILGWLRLFFVGLIILSVVYFLVSVYLRSVRRENLEKRWVAEGLEGDRDPWIEQKLKEGDRGLRHWLLWLIYIIPMVTFSAIFFYVNWT